jgi:hypothetical protein
MNNLTIELMNKANEEVGFTGNVVEMAKVQKLMDKFAELIVRECATLAYDGPNGILEHFGVEE